MSLAYVLSRWLMFNMYNVWSPLPAKIVSNPADFKTFFQSKILVWFKAEKVKQKFVYIPSFVVFALRRFQIEDTF